MTVHNRGVKPALSADPTALHKAPTAPRYLSAYARDEWRNIMPQLIARQIITLADLAGVENYCTCIGIIRQIETERQAIGGMIDKTAFGILNRAAQTARQLAAEYGLTPTSRARMGNSTAMPDDDNPLSVT